MPKREDLTGNTYGRWTALYYAGNRKWHCVCSCEDKTERDVSTSSLKSGLSVSCGCYRKERLKEVTDEKLKNDLKGNTYGNFIVDEYIENEDLWYCFCIHCGNKIKLSRRTILACKKKSCGCLNKIPEIDLTGMQIGLWKIIDYAGSSKWNCECQCEHHTKAKVSTSKLIHNKSKKCKFHGHKDKPKFPDWFISEMADKSLVDKINTHDKIEFVCPIHGNYTQAVSEHIRLRDNVRKSGCPFCAKSLSSIGSKNENEILHYIKSIGDDINIVRHTKLLLDGKEIDIYLPDFKIGIEYNGSAFHATVGGAFNNLDKYYHRDKFLLAKEKGIHLISVFDIDYEDYKDKILDIIYKCMFDDKDFFIPSNDIEITNNDYDCGIWLKDYGYTDIGQLEPSSYTYNNHLVYRSGKTIWKKI